ncbi:MAG: hypothetical protein ACRD0U_14170 [Acidimicrobiales bacterium]
MAAPTSHNDELLDIVRTSLVTSFEQGAHTKAVEERMGHSSIAVTLDRYGHLLPSIEERIAAGLDEADRAAFGDRARARVQHDASPSTL